jgi:hypothetical protein
MLVLATVGSIRNVVLADGFHRPENGLGIFLPGSLPSYREVVKR